MKKINRTHFVLLLCIAVAFTQSCKKESTTTTPVTTGNLSFTMSHAVHGTPLRLDTLIYQTSLGYSYMVNDLQYFISAVTLHEANGGWLTLPGETAHYTDPRIPSTIQFTLSQPIPAGKYDSLTFIFGLDQDANTSGRFPDPPERDMFWPDILGGGYHYMKLNLKWRSADMTELMPFMFHLGIGQVYQGTTTSTDSIIGYVQNYFPVTLPLDLVISAGQTSTIGLIMNIEKWFDGQNAFDFSEFQMGIMQNQYGMHLAILNGRHAFSIQQ